MKRKKERTGRRPLQPNESNLLVRRGGKRKGWGGVGEVKIESAEKEEGGGREKRLLISSLRHSKEKERGGRRREKKGWKGASLFCFVQERAPV